MNDLQNQWGPDEQGICDYTSKTRSDFEMFLSNHPPSEFFIEFNLEIAIASMLNRQAQEARKNPNFNNNDDSNGSEPPRSISMSSHPINRILYNWEKG